MEAHAAADTSTTWRSLVAQEGARVNWKQILSVIALSVNSIEPLRFPAAWDLHHAPRNILV